MWRRIHSLLGLVALVLVTALALSGAVLAFYPVKDALAPGVAVSSDLTVAALAGKVAAELPDVQVIHTCLRARSRWITPIQMASPPRPIRHAYT